MGKLEMVSYALKELQALRNRALREKSQALQRSTEAAQGTLPEEPAEEEFEQRGQQDYHPWWM